MGTVRGLNMVVEAFQEMFLHTYKLHGVFVPDCVDNLYDNQRLVEHRYWVRFTEHDMIFLTRDELLTEALGLAEKPLDIAPPVG